MPNHKPTCSCLFHLGIFLCTPSSHFLTLGAKKRPREEDQTSVAWLRKRRRERERGINPLASQHRKWRGNQGGIKERLNRQRARVLRSIFGMVYVVRIHYVFPYFRKKAQYVCFYLFLIAICAHPVQRFNRKAETGNLLSGSTYRKFSICVNQMRN